MGAASLILTKQMITYCRSQNSNMKKLTLVISLAVSARFAKAGEAGFQASLTPDIAINSRLTQIDGVALSIWGENPQHAFALGFINGSTGDSLGFSLGLLNYSDSYIGVSIGLINVSQEEFHGWQDGLVNISQGTFSGFQSGWVNVSEEFHGLQYGFINYAENLDGVQIGLVNIAMENPWFDEFPNKLATGFPIVNWSF
jgi:hypothetical protein